MVSPPLTPHQGQLATFADVATTIAELSGDHVASQHDNALKAFRTFLTNEEQTKLSKDQLKVLRSRFVLVLQECARQSSSNITEVLLNVTEALNSVSNGLQSTANLETALNDPSTSKDLEDLIGKAYEVIDVQLRGISQEGDKEPNTCKEALCRAQEDDRKKIARLELIMKQPGGPHETFDQHIHTLMKEQLKIIGDRSEVESRQKRAKQVLATISELTGESLPASTLLDIEFVTIGKTAINQGNSYDIFLGEYFTGEKIAIKVLRQRVSHDTAQKMHERFARQTLNWASLRHENILPFYGVGVMSSPVSEGEFQLYMVSPYLQNQDVQRYLKKYEKTSRHNRLQMIYDIARGLEYMHGDYGIGKNSLVHSSLNPSNVLIKDSGRAVISGFGYANILDSFQKNFTGDNLGYRYMGPEMIDESVLTHGSDIWAWAMTSLEILTDEPPYGRKTKGPQVIRAVGQGRKPKRRDHPKIEDYGSSDVLWEIFEQCWELNSEDRPGAGDVVNGLRPLLQQLGNMQDPDTRTEILLPYPQKGQPDSGVQLGGAPQFVSIQQEPGKDTKLIVQGGPSPTTPPHSSVRGTELGKASQPAVPGFQEK